MNTARLRAAVGAAAVLAGVAHGQTDVAPAVQPPGQGSGHASHAAEAAAQVMDPRAASTAGMAQRAALLEAAETALQRGMPISAAIAFEQAAMMLHAADSEMGLVRAWMQQGEYRRALAFAAHTAGAHLDAPAAGALYAWLLRLGAQEEFARRTLAGALQRAPDDRVVVAVAQALLAPSPGATGLLLEAPHRMAPYAEMLSGQFPPPATARLVSSGVLVGDGERAIVPLSSAASGRRLWVRNGLGQTTEAVLESLQSTSDGPGFAVLRLSSRLTGAARLATRDAFAGSPGFAIAYSANAGAQPAWPWMRQGFFGAFGGPGGMRRLGIPLPPDAHGGPVFDAAGRLAGIALQGADGPALMLPVSMFRDVAAAPPDAPLPAQDPADGPLARLPFDEAYERGLLTALQVLALP